MRPPPIVALLLLPAAGACMERGEYPSLKPRAFELAARNAPPPPPPAPLAPPRAEVVARIGSLLAKAQEGQRAFAAETGRTRAAVARAGGANSESWIDAQTQLSALDASRVATVMAMADLDALTVSGVDPSGLRFGEGDLAALRAAGAEIQAVVQAQGATLAALAGALAAP